MIWHILKKDLRRLWVPAGVAGLLLACLTVMDAWRFDWEVGLAETLLNLLVPLAWAVLIALAVQLDPLTSDKAFWLTRPVRRPALLFAKLLFAVVVVHGPMLVSDVVILTAHGFGPLQESLLWKHLLVLLVVTLPSLAIASVTSSVAGFGWCALAGGAAALLLNTALVGQRYPWSQRDWVPGALALLLVTLGGAVMLAVQYRQRWALGARVIGIGIALGAVLVYSYAPRDLTGAMQCALERDLRGPVELQADAGATGSVPFPFIPSGRVGISLPVRVTGVEQAERVVAEQLFLRVSAPGGRRWEMRRDLNPQPRAYLGVDPRALRQGQFLLPERSFVQAIGSAPVQVEGRASVRALRAGTVSVLPAVFGATDVPNVGRCYSALQPSMFGVENLKVTCEAPGALPPLTRVIMKDPETGREWQQGLGDSGRVLPYPSFTWLSPVRRLQTFLRVVESDSGRPDDRWLVPRAMLDRARIFIHPTIAQGCKNVSYSFTVANLQEYITPPAR